MSRKHSLFITVARFSIACLLAVLASPLSALSRDSSSEHLESFQKQSETTALPERLLSEGITFYRNNRSEEAIEVWQQALIAYREIEDQKGEVAVLGNIGIAYRAIGEYDKAIDFYQRSLLLNQELGDAFKERQILGNLGNVYAIIGQYNRAIDYQHRSHNLAHELQDSEGIRRSLANLGATYADKGDYDEAISYYQQSLEVAQDLDNLDAEATLSCNLGSVYNVWKKEYALALDHYQQCLESARIAGNRWLEAEALSSLGFVYEGLNSFEEAMQYYDEGLALFKAIDSFHSATVTLNNRAHTLVAWNEVDPEPNRLQAAERDLRQSIEMLEKARENLATDSDRISTFDIQLSTYNLLQQVLVAQEKFDAALEASEEGRSRAFATLLSDKNAQSEAPFGLEQLRRFAQENQTTIVEYTLIPDDDFIHQGRARGETEELFVWVVKPTGDITFHRINLKEKGISLSAEVELSLKAFGIRTRGGFDTTSDDGTSAEEQLRKLHEVLIAPIQEELPKEPDAPIVFVPQGELLSVAFAALTDSEGHYLIEHHTILTAPSIQVLQLSQNRRSHRQQYSSSATPITSLRAEDFLIVGNPQMPEFWDSRSQQLKQLEPLLGAETEAQSVANLFSATPLLNHQATEQAVRQRLSEATVIHLATHGLLEYGNPMDSGISDIPGAIALTSDESHDGLLTAAEISEQELTADLVVLSACDTGLGQITGDGVIGLSRSLIGAGASNVIVSLWAVPDAPTAQLMTEFYQRLQQGQNKAQALRQAMLTTMEQNPDPSAWAAFTLIGQAN